MAKKKRAKTSPASPASMPPDSPPAPSPIPRWLAWGGGTVVFAVVAVAVATVGVWTKSSPLAPSSQMETQEAPAVPAVPVPPPTPLKDFKVVNAHDHLMGRKYLGKYLKAAKEIGIVSTVFVASSEYTLMGAGHDPTKGNDENTEEILAAAREHPGQIIPFCTIHPGDPEKLDRLKRYVAEGARGLKLYSGHGNFYDRPLDVPDMMPVYAYCQETGLPICWHVNMLKYAAEFERVLKQFPKMKVIVPHFGVTFFHPRSTEFAEFDRFMATYPCLYTDTSFGTRSILVDGLEAVSRAPEPFRDFIHKYSDRVLYGTDMVITGNREKTEKWIADVLRACREVLEKDTYTFAMGAKGSPHARKDSTNVNGTFRGLALDDDTLRKIYETNIVKLLGDAPHPQ